MREISDSDLDRITTWEVNDLDGLMAFIRPYWEEYGTIRQQPTIDEPPDGKGVWYLATGGWSDNEAIIGAMKQNLIWWALHWYQSRCGGAYWFHRR